MKIIPQFFEKIFYLLKHLKTVLETKQKMIKEDENL